MHALVLSLVFAAHGAGFEGDTAYAPGDDTTGCESCDSGCGASGRGRLCSLGCCGPMPQTCYAPRFGCYPGNERCMHRYPAFHGSYYRRPYNYRNLFDYPWHAELHEPTSLFTYNVEEEAEGDDGEAFEFGSASARRNQSFGDHPRGEPAPTRR